MNNDQRVPDMRIKTTIILILTLAMSCHDNKGGASNPLEQADNLFAAKDYTSALAAYQQLIATEGSVARVGAGWCSLKLNDYISANTYFSLSAGDSIVDGYAGWSFIGWATGSIQQGIDRADFVLRKEPNYVFLLDDRIQAKDLIYLQAMSYYQLSDYPKTVERIRHLPDQSAYNPNLGASDIGKQLLDKLQSLGAVNF